ncbi:MAG TPA: hypothetical protein VIH16_00115 [Bellilinea sp.]
MKRLYHKLKNTDPAGRNVILCTLLVLLVFVAAIAMSEPLPSIARDLSAATLVPTPLPIRLTVTPLPNEAETAELTPTRTPIPPELLENADATDGIIIGTVVLVILVLAGTIAGINVRRKQHLDE